MFGTAPPPPGDPVTDIQLTQRQRQILDIIDLSMRERGYPPSVREIGEKVGLTSPSTVHTHLASLQRLGFLRRDPTKPRAIEVRYDPNSGAAVERRPVRHVPLVGDVAAGTDVLAQENVEELLPLPADFCGDGDLFMLRVRGDSMIDAGILDGDFVVAKAQDAAEKGDVVVAGIPNEEATVKTFNRRGSKVVLEPSNPRLSPMEFEPEDVTVYGRVVTVLRRL
jgi:repressor LexA